MAALQAGLLQKPELPELHRRYFRLLHGIADSDNTLVSSIFWSRSSPVFLFTNCHGFDGMYCAAYSQLKRALTITTAWR